MTNHRPSKGTMITTAKEDQVFFSTIFLLLQTTEKTWAIQNFVYLLYICFLILSCLTVFQKKCVSIIEHPYLPRPVNIRSFY